MKKILLLAMFLLSFFSNGQESNLDCVFVYELKASIEGTTFLDTSVKFDWDFSKLDIKEDEVTIEIIPILDCFNNDSASDFRETIFIKSNEKGFKTKGSKSIKHLDMMAKCFKYRMQIVNSDCVETSEWEFVSFFDN